MRSKFILHCLKIHTQSRSKKVDLEPSPERGSDKINMLKQRRNTEKCNLYPTAWSHIWILALKEVDLEPSSKGGITGPGS